MQKTSRDKGIVIEELGSDDEGVNHFHESGKNEDFVEPYVEHPDDDVNGNILSLYFVLPPRVCASVALNLAPNFPLFVIKALIKSTSRARDSLLPKDEPKLAVPLLLLIAQHRSQVVINADAPYIKMLSKQFDRFHGTLLQYVEFLCSAVSPASSYGVLIPSLNDLVHLYHLDPEVAFLIYRPMMRLFKSERAPHVCWPLDDKNAASDTSTNFESDPADHSSSMVLDLGSSENPIRL
ncbi:hypothetical protein RIF29_39502 [Crotalaria pallida]|uniref:Uncharacterized protein n=1 Tax=Crotalaria pallida TaxID=3830 RepID=A0AAN9E3S4_CROPI